MYRYCDYFPKSVLYKCGMPPEAELPIGDVDTYSTDKEALEGSMRAIFDSFKTALARGSASDPTKAALDMGIGRRIVCAFYDIGALDEGDKERYPIDTVELFTREERERISLSELAESPFSAVERSAEIKAPAISKSGRELI